jgi:hypothetical protein
VASAQAAVTALQQAQTPEDKLRGTADLNAHANSLGLTGVINAGNLADQELALTLWRQDKLTIRMRPVFPADSPQDVETRVLNNFSQVGRAVAPPNPRSPPGGAATTCFGRRASANASAATTPCHRSSSRRRG